MQSGHNRKARRQRKCDAFVRNASSLGYTEEDRLWNFLLAILRLFHLFCSPEETFASVFISCLMLFCCLPVLLVHQWGQWNVTTTPICFFEISGLLFFFFFSEFHTAEMFSSTETHKHILPTTCLPYQSLRLNGGRKNNTTHTQERKWGRKKNKSASLTWITLMPTG